MQEDKIACLLEKITEEQKLFTGLIAQAAKLNAQSNRFQRTSAQASSAQKNL